MVKNMLLRTIHPLLLKALSKRRKFELMVDGEIPEGRNHLFCCNHYCIHDIPTAGEVIKEHTYVLVSDEDKNTPDGLALSLNGTIWMNRRDKADRLRAKNDILRHLKAGHNVLMYPEATWNLTANLPMLGMNWGIIKIAQESNVPIIPIYLFFTEEKCLAKVGKEFMPQQDPQKDIEQLRDLMASLFWDLLEKQPLSCRESIPDDNLERSIAKRYDEYGRAKKDPDGVREYESRFIFKPRDVVEYEDAFEHLRNISPSLNNAFLFSKFL